MSSTACARLSTYPSGFTAGWFSSPGLRHEKHFIQSENLRYQKQKFTICMLASPLELWGLHCNSLHWQLKVSPHFKFAPNHLCKYAPCSKTSLSAPYQFTHIIFQFVSLQQNLFCWNHNILWTTQNFGYPKFEVWHIWGIFSTYWVTPWNFKGGSVS